MIANRQIEIIDDLIPTFRYKGKVFYLDIEDYKTRIASSLPIRESIQHYDGDKVKKVKYWPTEDDITVDDIKKFIIDNLSDWREEE